MSWCGRFAQGFVWLAVVALAATSAVAQEASGSITGVVVDEQGQTVPGATVTVVNERTANVARVVTTEADGSFRVLALLPDTYTVTIEMPSFRTLERKGNVLNVSAHLSLGRLKMVLGQIEEVVVVEASGAQVNPEDSQHTGLLTATQIENIQTKARDVMSLLRLMPGVRYEEDGDAMGDSFGKDVPNMGGLRRSWNQVTVDGLNGNELSGTSKFASAINLDAIAEVRVLLNSYKAEYGRTGGANIQIVSKGGGSKYRGALYWYGRRDEWNANRWAEKRAGRERPEQKFDTFGFNVGGPVKIPGLWEPKEKKLFFNYSVEIPQILRPGTFRRWKMPTELERQGDFSQTLDSAGRLVLIRDPLANKPCTHGTTTGTSPTPADFSGCFPGNKIPADRIDKSVQGLLNLLPLPNAEDPNRNFNFTRTEQRDDNRSNHVLRLDWKPTGRDTVFLTVRTFNADQMGDGIPGGAGNAARWGWFKGLYDFSDNSIAFGHTRIFGPNLINEFSAGGRRQTESFLWADEQSQANMLRSSAGWTIGQFHPDLNPLGILPIARFGGSSSGVENVEFTFPDRQGSAVADWLFSFKDNLTYTTGPHAFKAGIYVDYIKNNEARGGTWMGNFNFSRNSANPYDTGYGFANGLLGVFQDYQEWDAYANTMNRAWMSEGYVQDTWKATRRLTVDYGVRFLWYTPYWRPDGRSAGFDPSRYDPAKAPLIYRPARVGNQNFAQNPKTGELVNAVYIGTFVPGTGDLANGMVTPQTPGMPRGLRENQGIHPEPRIGFAYDVFGNAKTAVHASTGLFHQARLGGGSLGNLRGAPFTNRGIMFYNTLDSFLLANTLGNRPVDAEGLQVDAKTPSTYKWSLGVQQDLGKGVVIDVSYVGNVTRHIEMERQLNSVPDGARFLDVNPQNKDPRSSSALPPEFLRPYSGYQSIRIRENWGTSNYNGLQIQMNRRYAKGLQFGFAYTYSKALTIGDDDPSAYYPQRPVREWYYAPADYNQAQSFVFNFTWDVPRASRLWNVKPVKILFDGWQLSGDYALVDGDWTDVVLDTTDDFDFTGGEGGTGGDVRNGLRLVRPIMVGNPELPRDLRDPETGMFRTDVFKRPTGRGDHGNAPRNVMRNAGINNLDLAIFKNFRIDRKRRVTLRVEGYNVLNHTQYSGVDRTARFDAAGNMVNGNFGKASSARRLREVQASVRLSF